MEKVQLSTDIPSVVIIGAGISGLNMAMYLKKRLNFHNFIIIEGEKDVGGTWLVNTYPGAACDVNSHVYAYYENLNPEWSSNYSGYKEIQQYLSGTADKFDVKRHIKFSTWVTKARFDTTKNVWKIDYLDKDTQQKGEINCNYLIGGVGGLRIPNVPEVFTKFEGPWVHSARWDHSIDLKDKVVGVIGSGASAVQIVPNIIDKVKELHVFQRSAPYVVPKGIADYSPWMKFLLKWIPFFQTLYYWYFFLRDEKDLIAFYTDSWASKMATQATEDYIKESFTDPVKAELMRPKYHFGCKRVTPADEYYKAIDSSKSFIHDGNIDRVEGKTLYMKDGTSQTLDVLILATGFNVSNPYKDIDIANLDGEHIDTNLDKQGRTPQLNYGITVGKMPNFFMMLGPTTGLGHNSITFILECQANYITKMLKHALYNNVTRIELKQDVADAYWKWVQRRVKPMVWYGNCKSWYQNTNGEVIAIWPGTCLEYWWKTYSPKFSEYDMIYKA